MTVDRQGKVIAISGIDTGIGKTVVTGMLARAFMAQGKTVVTQKLVQTGCVGQSEDILTHRRIMGSALLAEDHQRLTCPYVYPDPCSPHLAAKLAGKTIELETLRQATATLQSRFDVILLEGAGGLFVPLQEDVTILDYLAEEKLPLILVSSSRLGSINHTLAALEALQKRAVHLCGVVYNRFQEKDRRIGDDSLSVIRRYVKRYTFDCPVIEVFDFDMQNMDEALSLWDGLLCS